MLVADVSLAVRLFRSGTRDKHSGLSRGSCVDLSKFVIMTSSLN